MHQRQLLTLVEEKGNLQFFMDLKITDRSTEFRPKEERKVQEPGTRGMHPQGYIDKVQRRYWALQPPVAQRLLYAQAHPSKLLPKINIHPVQSRLQES
jgi:hypothetical protein